MSVNRKTSDIPKIGNEKLAYLFEQDTGKYNKTVTLALGDKPNRVKIFCKEPYAQSMYDMYTQFMGEYKEVVAKDLQMDQIYKVKATSYCFDSKIITCDELSSGAPIYVTFNEYGHDVEKLKEDQYFEVMVVKEHNGAYYGSCRKYEQIKHHHELKYAYDNKTKIDVTITELIKGGYIATYKDSIRCFVPGAHAAANIILDFQEYIGKTIPVIVDNYDYMSKLFIVSFKKYIKHAMHTLIHDLEFGKKYVGKLTSKPTDFGIFVEFDDFYTGLIHKTEFRNYSEIRKSYQQGDSIDFYIKNITLKDKQYRIILTINESNIDVNKMRWARLKAEIDGQVLSYLYNKDAKKFYLITERGEHVSLDVTYESIAYGLDKCKRVKVFGVDIINQHVRFDFIMD